MQRSSPNPDPSQYCSAPPTAPSAWPGECLKRAPYCSSDLFTRNSKIPYRSTCCYRWENCWYGNRHPLMLLSDGHVSFQMSEELMSQWDSAPLGKNVSRHSPVTWWVWASCAETYFYLGLWYGVCIFMNLFSVSEKSALNCSASFWLL